MSRALFSRLASAVALGVLLVPAAAAQTGQQSTSAAPIVLDTITLEGGALESAGYSAGRTEGYRPVSTSLGSGTDTDILDIPQAVAVVAPQVLKDQDARTLEEALWNISGVIQTNTLGGTQDAFLRRGFGDNRDGGVLTDGLKTTLPRSFNATTDRVEVLKGPSSALYGILDPGGLINVVAKKPEYDFSGSAEYWLTSFGGGGGATDVTGPFGETGFAYRFVTEYEDTKYWRNFGDRSRKLLAPSFAYQTDSTRIDVGYLQESYALPFDRGTIFDLATNAPVDVDRRTRFDEAYNITDGSSQLATAALTHEFNEDWLLRVNYAYSENTYYDNQARVIAYNAATGVLTRRADATQNSYVDQHAARADIVGHTELGGLEHELLFGASYDYANTLRTNLIRSPNDTAAIRLNIYNPIYGRLLESNSVSAPDSDQTERIDTWSVYGQDSVHLTDRFIVVGGLRYQAYDQIAGRGRPFVLNTDVAGGELVPRAGLVYKLTPDVSLYGNWSRSFKPNSSIASAIGALPAETGESYEVGAKADLAHGLTLTAALFTIEKANVLYSEIVGSETRTTTAGKVRSRGLELDLAGQLTETFSAIATYAYTDAQVEEDPVLTGKRLTNVPEHSGSLFLAYDFADFVDYGVLRAGFGGRYVGERAGTAANTFDLPDYTVFDAFVSYAIPVAQANTLTLQANVKNVFDKTYYPSSIGTNNLGVEVGEPMEGTFKAKIDF